MKCPEKVLNFGDKAAEKSALRRADFESHRDDHGFSVLGVRGDVSGSGGGHIVNTRVHQVSFTVVQLTSVAA
jgi:hypothetical protein